MSNHEPTGNLTEVARVRIATAAAHIEHNTRRRAHDEDVTAATLLLAGIWDAIECQDFTRAAFDDYADLPLAAYLVVRQDARNRGEHR